jgi:hypothetical protein
MLQYQRLKTEKARLELSLQETVEACDKRMLQERLEYQEYLRTEEDERQEGITEMIELGARRALQMQEEKR